MSNPESSITTEEIRFLNPVAVASLADLALPLSTEIDLSGSADTTELGGGGGGGGGW